MSFRKFLKLPAELQLRIWRFAVPEFKTIVCKITSHDDHLQDDDRVAYANALATVQTAADIVTIHNYDVPCGLLAACVTSRAVLLEIYKSKIPLADGRALYCDGANDTIVLFNEKANRGLLPGFIDGRRTYPAYKEMFHGLKTIVLPDSSAVVAKQNAWALCHFDSVENINPLSCHDVDPYDDDIEEQSVFLKDETRAKDFQIFPSWVVMVEVCRSLTEYVQIMADYDFLEKDFMHLLQSSRHHATLEDPKVTPKVSFVHPHSGGAGHLHLLEDSSDPETGFSSDE